MGARIITIEGKLRQTPIALVSRDDFRYREGAVIHPHIVLEQPTLSLYCLDHAKQRAIFVKTPPEVDLSAIPFYYQTQYQAAQQLIAVSYDTLHELANEVQIDPGRIILIYSVGRCGSTLVSHALNQTDGVVSYSEPDVYTQILRLREGDRSNDIELCELLRSCTRVMCAPTAQSGRVAAWALKFRCFVIELGDLFYRNFPAAKVIFLYRHAEACARAAGRAFRIFDPQTVQWLPQLQQFFSRLVPLVAAYSAKHQTTISPVELLTCMWVSVMERCLDLQRQGVPMFAARYEELKAAPREVLDALFAYCGASVSNSGAIDRVLAQDAQAGTSLFQPYAQEFQSEVLDEHLTDLHRLMGEYSPTLTPDFVVPNTFRLTPG